MGTAGVIFPLLGKTLPFPISTHNATVLDTGDLTCSKTSVLSGGKCSGPELMPTFFSLLEKDL